MSEFQNYTIETIKNASSNGKSVFFLTDEQISSLTPTDESINISTIVNLINENVDDSTMIKLKNHVANEWLLSVGILAPTPNIEGKTEKLPTDVGKELGITTEWYKGMYSSYTRVLYGKQAQQFIYDNIYSLIEYSYEHEMNLIAKKRAKMPKNSFKPWTTDEEEQLLALYKGGALITDLAQQFERTYGAIKMKLEKLKNKNNTAV